MDIVRDANVSFDQAKVSKLIKKFKEAEEEGLPDEEIVLSQPRTGRPKTATASNVEKKVVKRVKDKRKRSLRKTSKWLKGKGIKSSKTSVARILQKNSCIHTVARSSPSLTRPKKKNVSSSPEIIKTTTG